MSESTCFFQFFFSTIKVNLVAKIMQSAYFVLFFFLSTKKSPYRSESKIKSKLNGFMPLTIFQASCILFVRHTLLLKPYQIDRLSFSKTLENVLLTDGHDALLNLHDQNIIFFVFLKRNRSNNTTTR